MDQIRLEDIVPETGEFTLSKTGKTYRLRPMTAADEIWMVRTFGGRVDRVFAEMRLEDICRIAFRLLEESQKEDFLVQDVTFVDDNGERLTQKIGGAELFFWFVTGMQEKVALTQALLRTIGVSRPVEEKIKGSVASEKKTLEELTGGKSSTSSQPSTDGLPNIA